MADRKDSFSLDGLFGGNFWDGVDTNVKQNVIDAVVGVLGKAGALTEAQAGLLRAQRDKAVLDTENGKLRQAGVRPGQYLSQRQREEILNPESKAERLQRLQFHGGMANGKWTNNYDEWKAASKNGHGTNSKGEEISTKSFGFSVPVYRANAREDTLEFESWKRGQRGQWAKNWAEAKSWDGKDRRGDHRGVRYDEDGMVTYRFGDDRTSQRLAARERIKKLNMLTRLDEYMKQNPELFRPRAPETPEIPSWIKRPVNAARDFLGGLFSDSKGGETMRERGWLDAVFAKAERAAMRGGRTRR